MYTRGTFNGAAVSIPIHAFRQFSMAFTARSQVNRGMYSFPALATRVRKFESMTNRNMFLESASGSFAGLRRAVLSGIAYSL
jgi:hypothetical protein